MENDLYRSKGYIGKCKHIVFPGPINCDTYYPLDKKFLNNIILGWTGSPATIHTIEPIIPIIDNIARDHHIKLSLVGVNKIKTTTKYVQIEYHKWTRESEPNIVGSFDIGLFRLPSTMEGLYRGGGKLFVYLALGIPFIASNFGIGSQIMNASHVGFPVSNESEWKSVLLKAILDPITREHYSKKGRIFAEKYLSHNLFSVYVYNIIRSIEVVPKNRTVV